MTTLKRRAEIRRLAEEAADTAVGLHNLGLSMKRDDHWQISAARVLDAARIMKALAASAIEARRAATAETDAVHESAVPQGDAHE